MFTNKLTYMHVKNTNMYILLRIKSQIRKCTKNSRVLFKIIMLVASFSVTGSDCTIKPFSFKSIMVYYALVPNFKKVSFIEKISNNRF